MLSPSSSSSLQQIQDDCIVGKGIHLYLLRIDQMHPFAGGNKLFKLKYNIEEAKKQNHRTLLTFGGAFSNHIAATAAAGKEHGFKTIGVIRGEEYPELNPTLKFATACGMQLHYVSRNDYQHKDNAEFLHSLKQLFGECYVIPEGGANEPGVKGCTEIIRHINIDFDHVCCACGTGSTLAGIILSLKENQSAIGFQSLKSRGYIKTEAQKWLNHFNSDSDNWQVEENYHFGGYAKIQSELLDFINRFQKNNGIPLDYIYTGKMMFGIYNLVEKGYFKKGTRIVAIHTGGLQGNDGFRNK